MKSGVKFMGWMFYMEMCFLAGMYVSKEYGTTIPF